MKSRRSSKQSHRNQSTYLSSGFNHQLSVSQLADLGVRRISVGSGLALAAWGAFVRAAKTSVQTAHSIFWLTTLRPPI